jgi:hypothetical protein
LGVVVIVGGVDAFSNLDVSDVSGALVVLEVFGGVFIYLFLFAVSVIGLRVFHM